MTNPAGPNGPKERADYGDGAADTAPAQREHPAIGVLRGIYRDIETAVQHINKEAGRDPHRGVPTSVEVDLRQAQALVTATAVKLKEAA